MKWEGVFKELQAVAAPAKRTLSFVFQMSSGDVTGLAPRRGAGIIFGACVFGGGEVCVGAVIKFSTVQMTEPQSRNSQESFGSK